jgi:hypothetical protein
MGVTAIIVFQKALQAAVKILGAGKTPTGQKATVHDTKKPHSPGFRGRQSASKGEGRSRLDFPLIYDAGSSYQPQNNANNIK